MDISQGHSDLVSRASHYSDYLLGLGGKAGYVAPRERSLMERDGIEAVEALHAEGGDELHFRFIGSASNRSFIVNLQFARSDDKTGRLLRPDEHAFVMQNILHLVAEQIGAASIPRGVPPGNSSA
jgi:hypothetical protein